MKAARHTFKSRVITLVICVPLIPFAFLLYLLELFFYFGSIIFGDLAHLVADFSFQLNTVINSVLRRLRGF